ncbi:MAG: hypothetical protein LHV69_02925 [Elusimicrobia bacterium]|nr:hypothetical protein [Candidatus Obscuribacterium magneticum]
MNPKARWIWIFGFVLLFNRPLFPSESSDSLSDTAIERLPIDFGPAVSNLFLRLEEQMESAERPPLLTEYLSKQAGVYASTVTSWDEKTYLARAEKFRASGLVSLAREEVQFVLRQRPQLKSVQKALAELSVYESAWHAKRAQAAREEGDLEGALFEIRQSLKIDPKNSALKETEQDLLKEMKLKAGLSRQVEKDYREGVNFYQSNQYDRALEYFVKVLNMDPRHKEALAYLAKIGTAIGKGDR